MQKKFNNKYKNILIIFFICIISFVSIYYWKIDSIKNGSYTCYANEYIGDNIGELKSNMVIIQEFIPKGSFSKVGIKFNISNEETEGSIRAVLENKNSKKIIQEWKVNISDLQSLEYHDFILNEALYNENDVYEMKLYTEDLQGKGIVTIESTKTDQYMDGKLFIDGHEVDKDLVIGTYDDNADFLKPICIIGFIMISLFVAFIYYIIFIKKCKIESVFIIVALFMGILYGVINTPYSNYDEEAHFNTAYRHSNTLLGIDNGEEKGDKEILKRNIDTASGLANGRSTISTYKKVCTEFFSTDKDSTLEPIYSTYVKEAEYVYTPTILAISIGRILHFGQVPLLMFGKLCNLLFYVIITYFAIKKIPFGKNILFTVALLPMALSQAASFSYDAFINAIVFLFTSYCIYIIFKKEDICSKDYIIFAIAAFLLAPLKKVYVLLCFISLLIPQKRFKNKKRYIATIGCFMFLIVVWYCFINFREVSTIVSNESTTISTYTFGDVKAAPLFFAKLIFKSMFELSYDLLECSIISFFYVTPNHLLAFLFIILLLVSTIKDDEEKTFINCKQRIFISIILIGLIMSIFLAAITWTNVISPVIEGVQGRYFLPILPLILLLFRNSKVVFKKGISKQIMICTVVLHVITAIDLFFTLLSYS